ncbi:MAG: PAS domain-containing protein [Rhodobacteraceae bacterium]|nr:PAS domain-containing protein [Paracoccaceae bacterium]
MSGPGDESLWASLPVPALLIGPGGAIEAANPAAEAFLNHSARVLVGGALSAWMAVEAPLAEAFARVRASHAAVVLNDVAVGTPGRAPTMCTIRIGPLADDSTRLLMLVSARDLAGRLGQAGTMHRAAKSAIGMAEMLAHEIKNPLAGIAGAAQLLSMGLSGGDRELTDLIVAETRRIVALLDQVEQFGNLRPPACRAVNLHDLIDRAHRSASLGFAAAMRFREEFDPSLPPAHVDPDQILQVLSNLIRNAAEAAGPQGGTITLRTFYDAALRRRGEDGAEVVLPLHIEIEDDGPGLPPDLAADVFEPFVSGRENGTGLGLALVGKIISDHRGWIAVESVPGRTVFRLSLPRVPKPGAPKPEAPQQHGHTPGEGQEG